jgi:hypothetical protein
MNTKRVLVLPALLVLASCSSSPTDRLQEYMDAAKRNNRYDLIEMSSAERRKTLAALPADSLLQEQRGWEYEYIYHHERIDDTGLQAWIDFSWIKSSDALKLRDSSRLVAHMVKEEGEWRMQYWEPKSESGVTFAE